MPLARLGTGPLGDQEAERDPPASGSSHTSLPPVQMVQAPPSPLRPPGARSLPPSPPLLTWVHLLTWSSSLPPPPQDHARPDHHPMSQHPPLAWELRGRWDPLCSLA